MHGTGIISQCVPAMQRTLSHVVVGAALDSAALGYCGPSQNCCVHMPSGGVQMPQLGLQQICPSGHVAAPHETGPACSAPVLSSLFSAFLPPLQATHRPSAKSQIR
jgi:hypothetical protein